MKRLLTLITISALFSLVLAAPALASAPTGDLYASRTAIGSLPFTDTLDTTEATTDGTDAEANASCGAPATDASVWYEFTAAADGYIIVDVSASDYSAGVIVVSGSPGTFTYENCGPGGTVFYAASGETYAILAFDDQNDRTGNGGTLNISVDVAPPPPTVHISINSTGRFNKVSGSATVSGTLTCTDASFVEFDVQLTQAVGRFTITGFGGDKSDSLVCDGTAQRWSVEVFGQNGKFKGGSAVAIANSFACGLFDCASDYAQRVVRLR